jgi:hypothetical protein
MGSMSGTFLEARLAVYLLCGGRANTMVEGQTAARCVIRPSGLYDISKHIELICIVSKLGYY